MGAGGRRRRNLKRKRTSKEPTATATATASSEGVDHVNDLTMKRNSNRKHQSPATKHKAQEEEKAQPAGAAGKKTKKRVVRERLPEKVIHMMMVRSHCVDELSGEQLARLLTEFPEELQENYAKCKALSEKWQAEQQALIDQYLINGYAEQDVTDDEDDGDDTAKIDGSKRDS